MNQLTKNQKIIIGIMVTIVAIGIMYYVYAKDEVQVEQTQEWEINELIEEDENIIEEKEFSDTEVIIYITGAVKKPGVYSLKKNSRITDAIDQAEGVKPEADISQINLAQMLEDGMKIYIPKQGEKTENNESNQNTVKEEIQSSERKSKQTVNINTATQTELETLPGIGPATALKIIEYRKQNGKFSKIEDIKQVKGIGESKYEQIKLWIKVK